MLGALVLCSPSEHVFFCCTLLTLQCACVNEWHALCETSDEPCSAVSRCLIMTEGSPKKGSLGRVLCQPANAKKHPVSLRGERPEMGEACELNFLFSFTFSWFLWPLIIAWGIIITNLICQIIDFQGNCDPCCYYVLLLRPHVWKCLALLGAKSYKSTFGSKAEL